MNGLISRAIRSLHSWGLLLVLCKNEWKSLCVFRLLRKAHWSRTWGKQESLAMPRRGRHILAEAMVTASSRSMCVVQVGSSKRRGEKRSKYDPDREFFSLASTHTASFRGRWRFIRFTSSPLIVASAFPHLEVVVSAMLPRQEVCLVID